jgi:uroporphyrinogen decarboxylase
MFREPLIFHVLMEKLSAVTADYLRAQIQSGAQAVQLFDTWAGLLSPRDYREYVFPHVQSVVERTATPGVPFILYGNGTGALLEQMARTGADVIGLDWRVDIADAKRRLGERRPLQGNLDPAVLFGPADTISQRAREILEAVGPGTPHVFNLGHGISRHTPVEAVETLVRTVHQVGREMRTRPGG